jgi:uncharacterized membrane protein
MNDLQNWEILRDKFTIEDIKIKLTLASGTFVVSLAFLARDQVMSYKIFLLISWISLVLSIIMGMWAMTVGATRYDRAARGKRGVLKEKEKKLYDVGKVLTPFEAKTPSVQTWSYTVGLLSFFLFVILNEYNCIKW